MLECIAVDILFNVRRVTNYEIEAALSKDVLKGLLEIQ